jgi:tagatose-1,6-bisphosphate aldolase non-catalytic subunit AgaZ/GatZ
VERTIELIKFTEEQRRILNLPPISYEVGTEEVHGGLVDFHNFEDFLNSLYSGLQAENLLDAWPCFIVGKVGTDLHTTNFDPEIAQKLYERVSPLGSLIKGHYTDWVANPQEYPLSGMGRANVGPEFTFTELEALYALCDEEDNLLTHNPSLTPSRFRAAIKNAVLESNRWKKWLLPDETGLSFESLAHDRQDWLIGTGARYVWTDPRVLDARQLLYLNLATQGADPHGQIVERIAQNMQKYIRAFNLANASLLF